MSIIAFVGLPGSGKSYGVVENVILKAFRDGRHVVTNIPLNKGVVYTEFPDARLTQIPNIQDYEDGEAFPQLPKGAVVVLDEVWRIWPSGMKADKIPLGAKEFLAEHRHQVGDDGHTTEIVLVVQDLAQCAAFAVRLVEKTYISRKHTELGLESRYVVNIFSGAIKGLHGPEQRLLGVIQGRYSADVWKFYQSHTQSSKGVVGNEQAADQRGVAWKRPLVVVGLPASVVALAVGWFTISDFFGAPPGIDELEPRTVQQAPASGDFQQFEHVPGLVQTAGRRQAAPDPVAAVALVESSRWRLAGFILLDGGKGFAILQSGHAQRTIDISLCEPIPGGQYSCVVDGQLVAAWTGKQATSVADRLIAPGRKMMDASPE